MKSMGKGVRRVSYLVREGEGGGVVVGDLRGEVEGEEKGRKVVKEEEGRKGGEEDGKGRVEGKIRKERGVSDVCFDRW